MPELYIWFTRVGGKEFVKGLQVLHYRHVNNNDMVTRLLAFLDYGI